jgi:hypothetical protein
MRWQHASGRKDFQVDALGCFLTALVYFSLISASPDSLLWEGHKPGRNQQSCMVVQQPQHGADHVRGCIRGGMFLPCWLARLLRGPC